MRSAKIKVIMLRKNRTAHKFTVNAEQSCFIMRGNLYTLPKEAVNLISYADKPSNPHAELIYIEGDPVPACLSASVNANEFLERVVIDNALKSAGQPKGFALEIIAEYLKSPGKLLMLTIVGIVIAAVLGGFLKLW